MTCAALLERGLLVTVNSDDPAYFGGYVNDNLAAVASTFDLSRQVVAGLARELLPRLVSAGRREGEDSWPR